MNVQKDNYKGFALFNDIEDAELRNRNRGVVLANIAQDNMNGDVINAKGAMLVLGYFNQVPEYERSKVKKNFVDNMLSRGFKLAA
jgi:hypothetical protein